MVYGTNLSVAIFFFDASFGLQFLSHYHLIIVWLHALKNKQNRLTRFQRFVLFIVKLLEQGNLENYHFVNMCPPY